MLAVVGLLTVAGQTGVARATPAQPNSRPPVVLFAVPGMVWSDVLGMPHLRELASRSSVGELSVKTRASVTRCAPGLLAVSAGNRTSAPAGPCAIDMSTWSELQAGNRRSRFDARVGLLGTTLQAAGIKTVAVGGDAVPMLANDAGKVSAQTASMTKALSIGGVIALLDRGLYSVPPQDRPAARTAVDARIAKVESQLPPNATFMVAGMSDLAAGHAVLHAFVISGPGWTHTELRSSAAGRAPYVQLIDIAPTILSTVGVHIPSTIVGRPMQRAGTTVPPISEYIDDNHHAVLQRTLGQRVFLVLGISAIVMMLLATARWHVGHRVATWLARLIAPAPAMIFIGNGLPWWRWGQWAYGLIVLGGCLVLAGVTTFVASRHRTAGLIAVPVFTFVALSADQFTGAHLQLSAPLGDSPLVAGRFSGMGNLDFAVMATSALLVAAIAGARLRPMQAVVVAGAVMLMAVVVDGAPPLGNDIGGVLALVPASLVLVALVAGVKVTKLRVVGVVVATIVVAVGVALVDYSRPATDQTHVGRFVGQVLHGGAGTEVRRKLDASLATFGWTIGTFVVVIGVVLAVIARKRILAALDTVSGGRAVAVAAAVVAVLGVALNDSGIVIAAMVAIVATSALYGGGLGRRPTRTDVPADATVDASVSPSPG
jgi:hypothetical protein